ncbi:MAG: hypothetical protein V4488_00955 [Pseudomonadota bacterium]
MSWITRYQAGNNILKQTDAQSCGYCCVGMIVNLLDVTNFQTEESLKIAGERVDSGGGAYDRATADRPGLVKMVGADEMMKNLGTKVSVGSGTDGIHLAKLLKREYSIDATYHAGTVAEMKTAMRAANAKHPMIVAVEWAGGSGHWVVVSGRSTGGWGSASDYTILDPSGHRVINKGSTNYVAENKSKGKFGGYYITVNGKLAMAKGPKVMM